MVTYRTGDACLIFPHSWNCDLMSGMSEAPDVNEREELPAWSLPADAVERIAIPVEWPERVTRDWALAGSTGEGVRVCVVDSGVEHDHPLVGSLERAVAVSARSEGELVVEDDSQGDLCGHGTACASIIRSLAPDCRLTSVRVLGAGFTGSGPALLEGLRWAVGEGFDVINLSLSTTKRDFAAVLHELADSAYFRRTMLVASAHNMPVESYPWRFASVLSVGSHEKDDALEYFYNPTPPVEFFARGVDVDVAWLGGGRIRSTGNSLATPHMAGVCALVLGKHPELTPFQLKSVLYLTAANVGGRQ
jgi:subtilisin family serine protease